MKRNLEEKQDTNNVNNTTDKRKRSRKMYVRDIGMYSLGCKKEMLKWMQDN